MKSLPANVRMILTETVTNHEPPPTAGHPDMGAAKLWLQIYKQRWKSDFEVPQNMAAVTDTIKKLQACLQLCDIIKLTDSGGSTDV